MTTKTFSKETLQNLVYEDYNTNEFKVISDDIVDTSRWSEIHEMIFQDKGDGKFYRTNYSQGLTECQDESPYEYDSDMIEVDQVVPKEVTVIKYVKVTK